VSEVYHERGVCLVNCIFYCMLRVGITAAKFAPQVVKICFSVSIEDCVSEMEVDELECLLYYEWRDATFNHCDVWGGETM